MIYGEKREGLFTMFNILENEHMLFRHDGYQQGIFRDQKPFYPVIGENVFPVTVDLTWRSKLQFSKIDLPEGLLLWQLNLGLEEALLTLTDEGQFLAQAKAIQEFNNQLYEALQERTFGICLYQGRLDFAEIKKAPEDVFLRRDYVLDYLKLVAAYLPEKPPLFLMLDGSFCDHAEFLALTSKEHYPPFHLMIKHPLLEKMPYCMDVMGWGYSTVMGKAYTQQESCVSKRLTQAFLMPHHSSELSVWHRFATHLPLAQELEARLIPETLLTEMWEGVDDLYLLEETLTPQGKRKVAGFVAAGGILHYL